jgi:hypothetical protein
MNIELPEDVKKDVLEIAGKLGPIQIAEGLKDLIVREKNLFMNEDLDDESRSIVMHGLSVLTAATSGYEQAAEEFNKKLKDSTIISPKSKM